jgi:hypothetical protein
MSCSKTALARHVRAAVLVTAAPWGDAALAIQVSVGQIDWLGNGSNPATVSSDRVRLSLLFDDSDKGYFGTNPDGGYTGYVNALTSLLDVGGNVVYSNNCAVQNAAMTFSDASAFSGRLADDFHFDISAGSPKSGLDLTQGSYRMQYSVSIEAGPVRCAATALAPG